MRVLPKQLPVQLGSYPSGEWEQSRQSKPRGQLSALGGLASSRAVTRVNPEQASKVKLLTPTCRLSGEGRCAWGKQLARAPLAVAGVVGTAREQGSCRNVGGPRRARGRGPQHCFGQWPARASERFIVPMTPGNAGRGKGPHFGDALNED
jgi:hypothetical protein